MHKCGTTGVILLFVMATGGCMTAQLTPEQPLSTRADGQQFRLLEPADVKVSRAARITLRQGTTWVVAGTLVEGTVYKTPDQTVIINSFDVHEGYPVVAAGEIVGFYLPVKETLVAVDPVAVELERIPSEGEAL